MTATSTNTWARRIGLAIGLFLALVAVLSWRVPAEGAGLGAEVRMTAMPPGEVMVDPTSPFLVGRRLQPGGEDAAGELRVRNIAPRAVEVQLRVLPSSRDLDRLLRVELTAGGRTLSEGTLAELRSWTTQGVRLEDGEQRTLEARAWLPEGAAGDHEGVNLDVTLELRAEVRR